MSQVMRGQRLLDFEDFAELVAKNPFADPAKFK